MAAAPAAATASKPATQKSDSNKAALTSTAPAAQLDLLKTPTHSEPPQSSPAPTQAKPPAPAEPPKSWPMPTQAKRPEPAKTPTRPAATPLPQQSDEPKASVATNAGDAAPASAAPTAQDEYVKTIAMTAKPAEPADIDIPQPRRPLIPVRDHLHWLGHKITATPLFTEILPGAAAKLKAYAALTRLNKPIGIWLLLWPVLWALWLSSGGKPDPHVFTVFVIGTVLTRSAGCAINDFADRKFDGHVKRTRDRPLVTGAVDPAEAVAICLGLGLIALGLALTLNQFAQLLTLVGGVLVLTYPFFKRFFPLPQAYLGIAFTWSVPMAYAAQTNSLPRTAWVLFLSGLVWTVAYDTMYAMADREDDRKLGIHSSALLFGDADRFVVGMLQLMTLFGLGLIGNEMELGLWYGLGLAGAAVFALYQQWLIRHRKSEDCFRAFLNNNYFGMSVFIGILLEYIFK
jgi:4-hydroxybenzoate polyprenyltransferase